MRIGAVHILCQPISGIFRPPLSAIALPTFPIRQQWSALASCELRDKFLSGGGGAEFCNMYMEFQKERTRALYWQVTVYSQSSLFLFQLKSAVIIILAWTSCSSSSNTDFLPLKALDSCKTGFSQTTSKPSLQKATYSAKSYLLNKNQLQLA